MYRPVYNMYVLSCFQFSSFSSSGIFAYEEALILLQVSWLHRLPLLLGIEFYTGIAMETYCLVCQVGQKVTVFSHYFLDKQSSATYDKITG